MRILSFAIMIYLKRLIGMKLLNTKQCPEGLPPRIIAHPMHFRSYKKIPPFLILLCCHHQVLTSSPLSPILCGKPWGWSKNAEQQPKKLLNSCTRKTTFTKQQLHVITQYKLPLWLSYCCCMLFFSIRLYVLIYHANFHYSMFTEYYLQLDKSIEWSKSSAAKLQLSPPFHAI